MYRIKISATQLSRRSSKIVPPKNRNRHHRILVRVVDYFFVIWQRSINIVGTCEMFPNVRMCRGCRAYSPRKFKLYLFLLSYSPDNLQTLELSSFQCHIVAYIDPGWLKSRAYCGKEGFLAEEKSKSEKKNKKKMSNRYKKSRENGEMVDWRQRERERTKTEREGASSSNGILGSTK